MYMPGPVGCMGHYGENIFLEGRGALCKLFASICMLIALGFARSLRAHFMIFLLLYAYCVWVCMLIACCCVLIAFVSHAHCIFIACLMQLAANCRQLRQTAGNCCKVQATQLPEFAGVGASGSNTCCIPSPW